MHNENRNNNQYDCFNFNSGFNQGNQQSNQQYESSFIKQYQYEMQNGTNNNFNYNSSNSNIVGKNNANNNKKSSFIFVLLLIIVALVLILVVINNNKNDIEQYNDMVLQQKEKDYEFNKVEEEIDLQEKNIEKEKLLQEKKDKINKKNQIKEDIGQEENIEIQEMDTDNIQGIMSNNDILSKVPSTHVEGIIDDYYVNMALGFYFPLSNDILFMDEDFVKSKVPELVGKIYAPCIINENDMFYVAVIDGHKVFNEYDDLEIMDIIGEEFALERKGEYKESSYKRVSFNGEEFGLIELGDKRMYLRVYDGYVIEIVVGGQKDSTIAQMFMNSIVWFEPNLDYIQYLNVISTIGENN